MKLIKIFVDTSNGKVSDHYDFAAVPRIGEVVFIQTDKEEIKLKVNLVEHYPPSKDDVMDEAAPITIQCEVMTH